MGNHVALAVWRSVRGRSGFDQSAQLLRLRGSTVLLVMVCMTNGLGELPFVCMGDWNMTPEEMQKTELMGSTGTVIKILLGVEFTWSSGNRLMDYTLVDRRLESVVKVKTFWAVPWKSHVALQISIPRAPSTHTMRIVCIPRKFSPGKIENKVA